MQASTAVRLLSGPRSELRAPWVLLLLALLLLGPGWLLSQGLQVGLLC